jgi:alkanesulfonate monooxygenase SsuD/methylene tetrahydromethanopterin reductase-like flavin-dependent oxidoreductase (luciferase family)
MESEYHAFGYPFDDRVGRFEEALTIIHTLLREGQIDFDGTYYQARDCELRPRGPRADGPPILIGSVSPRMLRLTAHHMERVDSGSEPGRRGCAAAQSRGRGVHRGRNPTTLERALTIAREGIAHIRSRLSQ